MTDAASRGRFDLIRTVVAVVGLVGLATAALLSGSDRQSREFPNSPSLVGWPYDTGAARAKAALAFVRSGPESAIGCARRAVLSDPLSAQAVSILGRSYLYAQHLPEARQAFEVSGQLGWRDDMTQIYWLDQAMQDGDYKVAAERLDALLRQSPDDENRDKFVAAVAASPEGRAALAVRLKLAPDWARRLSTQVDGLPADQLLQRIDLMRRTGKGVWDCAATEPLTQKLINQGMLNEAQSVWRLNCEPSNSLVYDGGFEHFDTLQTTSAFDWQISSGGDADVALNRDGAGHQTLALEVISTSTLPIVRQLIVLEPGHYRLTWRTPASPRAQARAVRVSLSCTPDLSRAANGTPVPGRPDTWTQDFEIDGECPARQLVFWLAPRSPIHLGDVSLEEVEDEADD